MLNLFVCEGEEEEGGVFQVIDFGSQCLLCYSFQIVQLDLLITATSIFNVIPGIRVDDSTSTLR